MWVLAALLVASAAGVAGASPAAPDSTGPLANAQALRAYAQGRLFEARGDYREALGEYIRALSMDRQAAPIARRVAELVGRMGDTRSAVEFADQALAVDSTDARSYWIKGTALLSSGRLAEALPLLQASVRHDSTQVEYFQALGHAAELAEQVGLVAWAYGHAVDLDPDDSESWFQLAAAQARLGRFAAADSSLQEANELAPLRPGQLFLQGWIAESLGRDDEAITCYRHHLELHADDQVTRRRLVNLLARLRRWAEAWPEARRVSQADPGDWETLLVEGEIAVRARKTGEARPALDRLEQLADGDIDRAGQLCGMWIRSARPGDAIAYADRWASRHRSDPRAPLLSARVRSVVGRRAEALPFAQVAVAAAPDSVSPRLLLARLYADLHRYDEAESTMAELVRRRPRDVGVLLELAGMREDRGDTPRAEAAAREALAIDPGNARLLNFIGYLMADHDRDLDEAERMIREALAQDPDNGAYVDSMGWVLYRRGRFEEARVQLERAADLTGGDPVVREHLGDAFRQLKQPESAREQYRMCLERDPGNGRVKAKLAGIHP
jgi:tetratricopeptide (TPR) repeat protein